MSTEFDIPLWYSGRSFYQSMSLSTEDIKGKLIGKRFIRIYLRFNKNYSHDKCPKFVMAIGRERDNEALLEQYQNSRNSRKVHPDILEEVDRYLRETRYLDYLEHSDWRSYIREDIRSILEKGKVSSFELF